MPPPSTTSTLFPYTTLFRSSIHRIGPTVRGTRRKAAYHRAGKVLHDEERDRGVLRDHLGLLRNGSARSEEHTSELQSQSNLVCRLLLEKKKYIRRQTIYTSF